MRMKKAPLRRDFLKLTALAAAASAVPTALAGYVAEAHASSPSTAAAPLRPRFPTSDPEWQKTWDAALAVLTGNIRSMPRYNHPVLEIGRAHV